MRKLLIPPGNKTTEGLSGAEKLVFGAYQMFVDQLIGKLLWRRHDLAVAENYVAVHKKEFPESVSAYLVVSGEVVQTTTTLNINLTALHNESITPIVLHSIGNNFSTIWMLQEDYIEYTKPENRKIRMAKFIRREKNRKIIGNI